MTEPASGAASTDALEELHQATARALLAAITRERKPCEVCGGIEPPTAAELTAAINFLAKNDIKARPVTKSPLAQLGEAAQGRGITLPFEGETPHTH